MMISIGRNLLPRLLAPSTLGVTQRATNSTDATIEDKSEGRPDELYRHLWVRCVGHETGVLESYEKFVTLAAGHLGIEHVTTETPKCKKARRTLLASRFVKKKYRVQYEIRDYKKDILFKNITGSTADTFLEYIERNVPAGVLLRIEKHQIAELPFEESK